MRWFVKEKVRPLVGDTRHRTRFAFLPKRIDKMYVWLDFYHVIEKYADWPRQVPDPDRYGYTKMTTRLGWETIGWYLS